MSTIPTILLLLLYLIVEVIAGYVVVRLIVGKPKTVLDRKRFMRGWITWVVLGVIGAVFFDGF